MHTETHSARRALANLFVACVIAVGSLMLFTATPAAIAEPAAITFTVNSPADVPDATPGDGFCRTAPDNTVCTLRAAVQETNKQATAVTIRLQPGVTYLLTRAGDDKSALNGDLDITGTVTIQGAGPDSTIIDGNSLDRIFEVTGTIVISNVTVQGGRISTGSGYGGGIFSGGRLSLFNSRVISNSLLGLNNLGGGIYAGGPVTIQNSLIAGNFISGSGGVYGGGIYVGNGLQMINSTVSGNTSSGLGGGLYTGGGKISGSTISGNRAATGGGMYPGGTLNVVNSTVSGNFSDGNGGGIYSGATLNLFNVTVYDNVANQDAVGSGTGGGIFHFGGAVGLANTIVAGNGRVTAGPVFIDDDCAGTLTSTGYSIVVSIEPHCTVSGSYSTGWPFLGPLQFNGGATHTHALLPGSAALNTGNPGGCTDELGAPLTTDQRGKPRPVFGSATRCDLGAFEVVQDLFLPLIRR